MKTFLKFGTVGVLNTGITIISYIFLVYLGVNYLLANVMAYGLGVLNSYYWNLSWVFKASQETAKQYVFLKFVLVNLLTLGITTGILYICVQHLHINAIIAQVVATGVGLVFNFSLNKKWTFTNKKSSS
ncbi:sugar translocase [Fictibacillus phosphorivorans]|uniref:Sugar translocase n=1 Tax=Fictibacillus phosphorivorans TaxID=1221500 RepID=A0A165N033_9BACL|nr:GtrA family protein [Fictibacillus phosphorivorans]KZE64100.1 sugar translocase [Fictibacillus phosphorivorans]